MTTSTVFWGSDLRKAVVGTAALIAGVATAITAVPPAWSALGLPEFASKSFVEGRISPVKVAADSTQSILRDLQIELAQGKQERTEDSISQWKLELEHAEDAHRSFIERHLQELQDTKTQLDDQLKTLRSLK